MIEYRSYNNLISTISKSVSKIPNDVGLIVGIPRSGMLPAYIIANFLNIGVVDLYSFLKNDIVKGGRRFESKEKESFKFSKILLIDDSVYSGSSMQAAAHLIKQSSYQGQVIRSCVYVNTPSIGLIDFYFEIIDQTRVFQWNLFDHAIQNDSFFDLDGVICADVPEELNDDAINYLEYISNAKVLYRPTRPIKKIVTCRLEKYRDVTTKWLDKNEIQYEELVMLNFPDGESRRLWGKHGEFKAEIYNNSDAPLFYESSIEQAKVISKLTGKHVYCVDTHQMIESHTNEYVSRIFLNRRKSNSKLIIKIFELFGKMLNGLLSLFNLKISRK